MQNQLKTLLLLGVLTTIVVAIGGAVGADGDHVRGVLGIATLLKESAQV